MQNSQLEIVSTITTGLSPLYSILQNQWSWVRFNGASMFIYSPITGVLATLNRKTLPTVMPVPIQSQTLRRDISYPRINSLPRSTTEAALLPRRKILKQVFSETLNFRLLSIIMLKKMSCQDTRRPKRAASVCSLRLEWSSLLRLSGRSATTRGLRCLKPSGRVICLQSICERTKQGCKVQSIKSQLPQVSIYHKS